MQSIRPSDVTKIGTWLEHLHEAATGLDPRERDVVARPLPLDGH